MPKTNDSAEALANQPLEKRWKVLIVDDDEPVHRVTELVLKPFVYENRRLHFLHAFSAEHAKEILAVEEDIAVILLDVVMETDSAGLDLVHFIRKTLNNEEVRIILRTGQPGAAPETKVVTDYDINDYKEKAELTSKKMFTLMYSSLRAYSIIKTARAQANINHKKYELATVENVFLEADVKKYQSLYEETTDGIFEINRSSVFVSANPATAVILGAESVEQLIGTAFNNLFVEIQGRVALSHLLRQCEEQSIEFYGRKLNGEKFWGILHAHKSNEKAEYIECRLTDISDKKHTAIALWEKEMAKLATEMAEKTAVEKTEFLATMSHEIRTLMNGVIGMADLLYDTKLDAEQREFTDTIHYSATALLELINDILDMSKLESNKLELDPIAFNLRNWLEDLIDLIEPRAKAKGLNIYLNISPQIPIFVKGDPGRIRQILLNLLTNAVKFTETGHIFVGVAGQVDEEGNANVHFSIEDTGIGIKEEELGNIFTQYKQANASTSRKYGGTGLGLAISAKLAELMDSKLKVTSEFGKGSQFTLQLKLKVDNAESSRIEAPATLAGKTVLQIDENDMNQWILSEQLRHFNINAVQCQNTTQAFEMLLNPNDVSLVIMDAEKDVSALEFAQLLDEKNIDLPVMVYTTNPQRGDIQNYSGSKIIRGYLSRPARYEILKLTLLNIFSDPDSNKLYTKYNVMDLQDSSGKPERIEQHFNLRVLLAEDNVVNQRVTSRILEKLNCQVVVVENGLEATDLCKTTTFDVIILDARMPKMGGIEAASNIRKGTTSNYNKPIIVLTADTSDEMREQCNGACVDNLLSKPTTPLIIESALEPYVKK